MYTFIPNVINTLITKTWPLKNMNEKICFKYISIPTNISIAAHQTEEQLVFEETIPGHKKPMRCWVGA